MESGATRYCHRSAPVAVCEYGPPVAGALGLWLPAQLIVLGHLSPGWEPFWGSTVAPAKRTRLAVPGTGQPPGPYRLYTIVVPS